MHARSLSSSSKGHPDILISKHRAETRFDTRSSDGAARVSELAQHMDGPEKEISLLQARFHELWSEGDLDGAAEVGDVALHTVDAFFGDNHPVYASVMNNMGLLYKERAEFERAVQSLATAVRIYKDILGDKHTNTTVAMGNLAHVYKLKAMGASALERHQLLASAREMYESNLAVLGEVQGDTSPDYGLAQQHLAAVLRMQGENGGRAQELARQGLAAIEGGLPADHPRVATALNNYALELKTAGKFEHALELYERALQIRVARFGEEHSDSLIIMNNMAELYMAWGREADARVLQLRMLDIVGIEADAEDLEDPEDPNAAPEPTPRVPQSEG